MIISSTRPKARKRHWCEFCMGPIQPGEHYQRKTDVTDGRMSTLKVCEPCEDISFAVWVHMGCPYDEGIGADDFRDWAIEHPNRLDAVAFLTRFHDRGVTC